MAQIQIVWCIDQGPPPTWLVDRSNNHSSSNTLVPDVVLELHEINSLNERFRVLQQTPTAGVLTVDDDLFRPCVAMDAGFFLWTQNPDRMVGFDARTHVVVVGNSTGSVTKHSENAANEKKQWLYGYMSTTEATNHYSLTLSRFAFVHVNYLNSYTTSMPAEFRNYVTHEKNCEDIALSFWITKHSGGKPPLLADLWATKSQVKLFSPATISGSRNHKILRDACVDRFADVLGLKDSLITSEWVHPGSEMFASGAPPDNWDIDRTGIKPDRLIALEKLRYRWKEGGMKVLAKELGKLMQEISIPAARAGLIQGTIRWNERFGKG